ncbi:MAG: reductive dehalogenase [Candidatus Hodarchaeales archaeon]|jgi:reductive dehalogenase
MTTLDPRKQMESAFRKGKISLAIDKSVYKRFSERDMIFARVMWDETYSGYRRAINEKESAKVGMKGYSQEGYAAMNAAWMVHDTFRQAFSWENPKEAASSPTQSTTKLKRYESQDLINNSKIIKRISKVFGACAVGVTELDPDLPYVFTHNRQNAPVNFPDGIKYAIVMLIQMDYQALKTSPALPSSITTGNGYSRMAFAVASMADFLRNLGYQAIPAGNDTGLSVPLAIQAGLGQVGRNGLLINPKYGQAVRICKVYTDFPLEIDEPIDFGVTQFCKVCKKCAKYCPSQSILYDDDPTWESPWNSVSNNDGAYKWYVNVESCYEFWVKNSTDCSNCIRVCPFTKPPGLAHDIARFFIKNFSFLDPLWLRLDNFMAYFPWWRYGRKNDAKRFWKGSKYLDK